MRTSSTAAPMPGRTTGPLGHQTMAGVERGTPVAEGIDGIGSASPTMARARWLAAWGALLLTAAVVRLAPWSHVFGPDRIRFMGDTDPHYHVLRAQRIIQDFPHIPWSDPNMNYPFGAVILWPPLFDLFIAVPAKLFGGSPTAVERVAVVLPVFLGLVTLGLVGALGTTLLDRRTGFMAAALLVFLPANVEYTMLGRPDQHVLELLVSCWIFLTFLRGWRVSSGPWRARRCWLLFLGLGMAVASWTWQGSGLYLVLLVLFTALWHVLGPGGDTIPHPARTLAPGATIGAALLALSLALVAPTALRETWIMGVTGFHVLLIALTALFAGVLAVAHQVRWGSTGRSRRALEVTAAALLPLGLAWALLPGVRESVARGLTPLAGSNPWYQVIDEFHPLLFSGWRSVWVEVARMLGQSGLVLVGMPLCALALARRWREHPADRPAMAFLACWGVLFLALAALRIRFHLYAVVPAALWMAVGLDHLAGKLVRRWPSGHFIGPRAVAAVGMTMVLAPAVLFLALASVREFPHVTRAAAALQWLRGVPSPPGREAVLASWNMGHAIQYYAGKPVVATPFGTDGGAGAMEDSAAFYLAPSPEAAEAVLARRRVGFLLLSNPAGDVHTLSGFAAEPRPDAVRVSRDWWRGWSGRVTAAFWALPVARLYFRDGSGVPAERLPALGAYRLLFETPSTRPGERIKEGQLKLFGVVAGARLDVENARPGAMVVATIPVLTNEGRQFSWATVARSDDAGRAALRIPYVTGVNGQVRALACDVSDGASAQPVTLTEAQVAGGHGVTVDLSSAGVTPRRR